MDANRRLYAHTTANPHATDWELLEEHAQAVAKRAAGFAAVFDAQFFGEAAGLLHDIGKASRAFQAYLRGAHGSVDHSTAGAQLAQRAYKHPIGKILAFCIAGHHAGLANGQESGDHGRLTSLADRLVKVVESYADGERLIERPEPAPPAFKIHSPERQGFQLAFFIRMVFSCLVDADSLETERFALGALGQSPSRDDWPALRPLGQALDAHLATIINRAQPTALNAARARILETVRERAAWAPGLFSLNVPTGGGKTLASLAFALKHAHHHDLRRVVYVIPFTSIVEQTAAVFAQAVGHEAVLEHHSAFDLDSACNGETEEERPAGGERLRLAAENWDAPIIVTTAVQFFESLFANKKSRCRKLHNLARAVIVLDEAQILPLPLLRACVAAIDELARNYGSTLVLCTATQPALERTRGFEGGLENVRELAPEALDRDPVFRRVRFENAGTLDDDALATRLADAMQALCIVNSRAHAKTLFEAIRDLEGAIHLSTLMCAVHRRAVLTQIRERLARGQAVRLVSTSLIEAGVDISFPLVLRAEAGLDQVLQAAGRCNREGEVDGLGTTVVFTPADSTSPPEITQLAAAAASVRRRFSDLQTAEAIHEYFAQTYFLKGVEALDAKRILDRLNERKADLDFPFESIAEVFRMIETAMVPIIIRYDDKVDEWLRRLEFVDRPGRLARKLQGYTVQIPKAARATLLSAGAARRFRPDTFGDQFVVLENADGYRADVGLTWDDPHFMHSSTLLL